MTTRILIWNENVHERESDTVAAIYPEGIHSCLAAALRADPGLSVETATLQDPGQGISAARLAATDVLIWWGHAAHGEVTDEAAETVARAVWSGMGAIFLHSAHFSKPFRRLMGSPCALSWREAGERERLWLTAPNHPIGAGVGPCFVLEHEEMYGEPFGVPDPDETVFISWFQGGEVFRSGLCWRRGAGRVFYFRPGHETYPTYHDANVQRVIRNAAHWAHSPADRLPDPTAAPNVPADAAPEPLEQRGPRLHRDGDAGLR